MALAKIASLPHTVIGIDNGIHMVAVECVGGLLTQVTLEPIHLKSRVKAERCHMAWVWAYGIVMNARMHGLPVHVFIEIPFVGPNRSAAIPLGQIQGAVMAACVNAGATVYEVTNSQWKRAVLGYGTASKDEITEAMRTRWPWLHNNALLLPKGIQQDAIDAGGVALYGIDVMRRADHIATDM